MGTSKKKKRSQEGCPERLLQIQPNGSSGGGPGGGGGGALAPGIQREHVPDIVFIVAGTDPAVQSAIDFHNYFGFRGTRLRRFSSIENLVGTLAGSTGHLNRIRIVAHAESEGILTPMVEGDARVNIEKGQLRAFLRGDGDWLFTKVQQFHFFGQGSGANNVVARVLGHILEVASRQVPPPPRTVLTPFNYTQTSHANSQLHDFVLCALTPRVVNGNFVQRNGTNLTSGPSGQKTAFIFAFDRILELAARNLIDSGTYPGVTIADLNALRDSIRSFTFADYGVTPGVAQVGPSTVTSIVRSVAALNNNFRARLTQAQQRFDASSWIDIRGCRAGTDPDYLVAIGEFFGHDAVRPHVSGPRWFQQFPTLGFNTFTSIGEVDNAFDSGIDSISGSAVSAALDRWLDAIHYDQNYFSAWRTAINGSAANFCLLTWRNAIPTTFLLREGKQHDISSLNFVDTITRIKSIFGVATGSQPTAATLTGLQTFVTSTLPGYMQKLTQEVTTNVATVFAELRTISQAESASIVPDTPPPGLTADQVRAFQTQLIDFISTHRLQHINSLLVTARTFISGTNGKYQLYLRFGVPGLVIFASDVLNDNVFALAAEQNNALRILLREMWEEPLPTPNNIGAARPDREQDRLCAALANDHQDTLVAVCPMPDYFDNIVST